MAEELFPVAPATATVMFLRSLLDKARTDAKDEGNVITGHPFTAAVDRVLSPEKIKETATATPAPASTPPTGKVSTPVSPAAQTAPLNFQLTRPEIVEGSEPSAQPSRIVPRVQGPQSSGFDLSDPVTKIFLAQAGLNLLAGGYGNPIQQIGEAIGAGGEAVNRYSTGIRSQQQQEVENTQRDTQLANTSARAQRSRQETAVDAATRDMSPEAQVYFRQRIKSIKDADPLTGEEIDPTQQFERIMQETGVVDKRSRMGKGQLRSAEIPDKDIASVAIDPKKEATLLSWVSASPTETELVKNRIQAARAVGTTTPLR